MCDKHNQRKPNSYQLALCRRGLACPLQKRKKPPRKVSLILPSSKSDGEAPVMDIRRMWNTSS